MRKQHFVWIDDDLKRRNHIPAFKNVFIEFLPFIGKPLESLAEVNKKKNVDLIFMDHFLNLGPVKTGSTIAELIRENHPNTPIVCVTAQDRNKIASQQKALYEEVFSIGNLTKQIRNIHLIANNFKKISASRLRKEKILNFFNPPKDEVVRLNQILPNEIRLSLGERGFARVLSDWVTHKLLAKPGRLYDRVWTANLLGLNDKGFQKVEKLFEPAVYNGIYSDDENKRWWVSKVKEILFKNVSNPSSSYSWEAGHALKRITPTDHSLCYFCNKPFPETIGHIDETENSGQVPLHFKHSKLHPDNQSELYFDEVRCMKD